MKIMKKEFEQLGKEFIKDSIKIEFRGKNFPAYECGVTLFAQWLDEREQERLKDSTICHELACVDAGRCVMNCQPEFKEPEGECKHPFPNGFGINDYNCKHCGKDLRLQTKRTDIKKVKVKFEMEDGKTLVFNAYKTKN